MSESFASSAQADNSTFPEAYSNTNINNKRHHRKQTHRPMQTSSQDARYNQNAYQQQQQQQQQQQWYPQAMYYDDYYYQQPTPRGGYSARNHQQYQQQRRPQYRQSSAFSQVNQQETVRPKSNSSARSTIEVDNLRSTLTKQLLENTYECMICMVKIKYASNFHIKKIHIDDFFSLLILVVNKKFGHVIYVIKCFI
jgi:hypothetical protein